MEEFTQNEMTPEEVEKAVQIDELAEAGDVVPVPPQIKFGISIFAMSEGTPVVHVTPGQDMDVDAEIPLEWLSSLLAQAQENLLFMRFKQNLAAEALRARARAGKDA
ncbi:MAG: hypothetical protein GY766_05500 [Herbaspirillum sp.]|uniref:hypothetical protein n=1 Tax=Herbaspirillum sp. TaxID=1890675 RepID=UPI0025865533|nr:hypothetical protein [Herbaspirillum sp.]MCP3654338.1 hypothetical protein [Herbaspirillum sp.]